VDYNQCELNKYNNTKNTPSMICHDKLKNNLKKYFGEKYLIMKILISNIELE
jgi:hypothetical protein